MVSVKNKRVMYRLVMMFVLEVNTQTTHVFHLMRRVQGVRSVIFQSFMAHGFLRSLGRRKTHHFPWIMAARNTKRIPHLILTTLILVKVLTRVIGYERRLTITTSTTRKKQLSMIKYLSSKISSTHCSSCLIVWI